MNQAIRLKGGDLQGTLATAAPPSTYRNTILLGDTRERLTDLPPASIDTVITSPPYYGLRNYGVSGQLGLEADVAGWVAELRDVMTQLAQVLKPTGVLWLNLGDGYARHPREGTPVKSLLLGPERLALSLVTDGWILRNKVIWAKTNPIPTSVTDRLSTTYEVIYCFTRSPRYFFDLDAIRVPHRSAMPPAALSGLATTDAILPNSAFLPPWRTHPQPWAEGRVYPPDSAVATIRQTKRTQRNTGLGKLKANGITGHQLGKNPGDVWSLATAGYKGAHFATFPVSLVERPLLASCPERVCVGCGVPWKREPARRREHVAVLGQLRPGCQCQTSGTGYRPGIVLDPFMGAGTVAVAAERHGREWLGIELNPDYAAMAEVRIAREREKRQKASQTRTAQERQAAAPSPATTTGSTGSGGDSVRSPAVARDSVHSPAAIRTEPRRPYDPRAA